MAEYEGFTRLATSVQKDKQRVIGKLADHVREATASGMTPQDVVDTFDFPPTVKNPYRAVASIFLGEEFNVTMEKAYEIYPYLKAARYPDITDEELVNKLATSEDFPRATVTKETYEEKAKKVLADFPAFAKEREKVESIVEKERVRGRQSYEKQFKPVFKHQALRYLENEYFGKGNQRDLALHRYFNALWEAQFSDNPNAMKQAATQQYTADLEAEQLKREKMFERIIYQIDNSTEEEGFWERKRLSAKRAGYRVGANLSTMLETAHKGLRVAFDPWIALFDRDYLRRAEARERAVWEGIRWRHQKAESPELWRPELNALDGMTNALLENVPTYAFATGAAILGGIAGGPPGGKAGMYWVMSSAERAEIYGACRERGYSHEESLKRAAMGGHINGLIEVAIGGSSKYIPRVNVTKRIIGEGGSFSKNVLKEIFLEEIPQETITAMLSGNVPYKPDGTLDAEEAINQILLIARDAGFMSAFYGAVQKGTEGVARHKARLETGLSRKGYNQLEDTLHEAIARDEAKREEIRTGKAFPGQHKYSDDFYIKTALEKQMPIVSDDLQKHPFMLIRNTGEDRNKIPWHIKNFKDPEHNLEFKNYKKAFKRFTELTPKEQWTHSIYTMLEGLPPEVFEPLIAKSVPHTESLTHIDDATQYYLVEVGKNRYEVRDADTGKVFDGKGLNFEVKDIKTDKEFPNAMKLDDAKRAKAATNIATSTEDPMIQVHRFTKSRADNGAFVETYRPISDLTDIHKSRAEREVSAQEIVNNITGLRENLSIEFDESFVRGVKDPESGELIGGEIPDEIFNKIQKLPNMIEQGVSHEEIANVLREVIRIGQKYGEGTEANQFRNYIRSMIGKVKKNKRLHVKKEEDVKRPKPSKWHKVWDWAGGVTKDDFVTTAVQIFGKDHIPLVMQTINARTRASRLFEAMSQEILSIQSDLDITKDDKKEWSRNWRKEKRLDLVTVNLSGEEHNLTVAELMYLDLASRDTTLKQIMQREGVELPDLLIGSISENEMIDIHKVLAEKNPKAAKFVDRLHEFYMHSRGTVVNLAAEDMLGHDIITREAFFPDPRRTEKGQKTGPLPIKDIFSQTTEDIRKASHYAGIKPSMRLLNAMAHNKELTKKIQRAGKSRHLKRWKQQLDAMDKVSFPVNSDLERAITKLGANRARSILANGRIAILQAGSFQMYQNETDLRYMRPGKVPKELIESWDLWQYRKMGMGSIHSVASKDTIKKTFDGHGDNTDMILWPMHKVDLLITRQAATIAWHEMTDSTLTGKAKRYWDQVPQTPAELRKMGISSPEFQKAFHDRASYLMYTTQPMFFPESRNYYSQHSGPLLKEMARFRSFTDQLLRVNARNMALWQQGEISAYEAFGAIGRNMAWASVWYNGLKWAFKEMFGEDDEEYNFFLEVLISPISWIPFAGWTLKTSMQYILDEQGYGPASFSTITFDQATHVTRTGATLAKAAYLDWWQGEEKKAAKYWKRGMREAAKDVLVVYYGLPDYPVDWIWPEEKKKKKKPRF